MGNYDNVFEILKCSIGSTKLGGMRSGSVDPGINRFNPPAAGALYPRIRAFNFGAPTQSFDSIAVASVLGLASDAFLMAGLTLPSGVDVLDMHLIRRTDTGAFAATTGKKYTVNKGFMFVNSLNVQQDALAVVSVQVVPVWNGTNNPVVISDTETPTADGTELAENACYTLGPTLINGSQVYMVGGFSMTPGLTLQTRRSDGDYWARIAWVGRSTPSATINFLSPVPLSTYGLTGGQVSATIVQYLTHVTPFGTREAYNAGTHIKLTINAGTITPMNVGAGLDGATAEALTIDIAQPSVGGSVVTVDTTADLPAP